MTGVFFKDGHFYENLGCGGYILLQWVSFQILNACLTQKADNTFRARISSGKRLGGNVTCFFHVLVAAVTKMVS